jgi:peptidoglycan hydrolase-like protein with peptidoglycan-binding domain
MMAITAMLIAPSMSLAGFGDRTLRKGAVGHDVRVLQSWLTQLGIPTGVDGQFGTGTARRVRQVERANKLSVNSTVERSQARLMRRLMSAKFPPGSSPAPVPESAPTGQARIASDGRTAVAPADAPDAVKRAIYYANKLTRKPYRYGGGHASFADSGYDCSGTVSYVLHGMGRLDVPMDSSELMHYGKPGPGRHITIYANPGHTFMVIDGRRYDTSVRARSGSRWGPGTRSTAGYVVRHPAGM